MVGTDGNQGNVPVVHPCGTAWLEWFAGTVGQPEGLPSYHSNQNIAVLSIKVPWLEASLLPPKALAN